MANLLRLTTIKSKDDNSNFSNDIKKIINYFNGKNIDFKNSRFRNIINIIDNISKNKPTKNELYLISETKDLSEIVNILSKYELQKQKKFKLLVKGLELDKKEKKTFSRDYIFELKIATRFLKSDFIINIESIADVNIEFNDLQYHIECKRVQSEQKIENKIKEAYNQLGKNNQNVSRGIIALDLSKVFFNTIHEIEEENNINFENINIKEVRKLFDKHFSELIENISKKILNNISFIICHVRFPIIQHPYQITTINHYFTLKSKETSSETLQIIEKLREQKNI